MPNLTGAMRDPREVLLGMGLATAIMFGTFYTILKLVRDSNVTTPPPPTPKAQYITQETEDSLGIETLDKLLQHPSYSIHDAALKILVDRAVNDEPTMKMLFFSMTVEDYEQRIAALQAINFLLKRHNYMIVKLHIPEAYDALVQALVISQNDRVIPKLDNDDWDEFPFRDMSERFPLAFIVSLVHKFGPQQLAESGFLTRYLAKQPWGDNTTERRRNFRMYANTKNNPISEIIVRMRESTIGYNALQNSGLVPKYSKMSWTDSGSTEEGGWAQTYEAEYSTEAIGFAVPDDDVLPEEDDPDMPGLENEAANDRSGGMHSRATATTRETLPRRIEQQDRVAAAVAMAATQGVVVPRTVEHSDEEQRLRRQHREAMVLNDGSRPVRRGDIIERDPEDG